MHRTFLLISLILTAFSVAEAQVELRNCDIAEEFIFNSQRPFTYLQFDHIGKGIRFDENETAYRIWFRLVNRCHVPIVIRTFGVPDGCPVGEAGVLHNVLAHPPVNVVSGGINLGAGASPQLAERPVVAAITKVAGRGHKFPGCRRRAIS